jgi:molybdate transport system ATP-binding protein
MSALTIDVAIPRREFTVAVHLEAQAGRTVALVGPNGAGKSTVIAAIAGVTDPSDGWVRLDDEVLVDVSAGTFVPIERRRLGLVFQDGVLFPHLTVLENAAFGIRARGVPRVAARQKAAEWLERLGVAALARTHPAALSGGQRQRVALARALAVEPRALLLDEPLASLDVHSRDEIRAVLAEHLGAFTGVTVLVTHSATDVAALADDVVVLEEGSVTQRGTVAELQSSPATPWIRRLVRDLVD